MYLSSQIVLWAIKTLRTNCHPFIGITFLASKRFGLPVGTTTEARLDTITKFHLEKHHRLDPKSEFFFQPFKSKKNTYWVAADYSSSGLQAINTQTFKEAFLHPRGSRQWGLSEGYIDKISSHIRDSGGFGRVSLAAMAIWVSKDTHWDTDTNLETIVQQFRKTYYLSDDEVAKLFDTFIVPPESTTITSEEVLGIKSIAYQFAPPPDAPSQTEGALISIRLTNVGPAKEFYLDFGERLTLIAGDNGLGKSFLLDAAWWALTSTWAGYSAQQNQYTHDSDNMIAMKRMNANDLTTDQVWQLGRRRQLRGADWVRRTFQIQFAPHFTRCAKPDRRSTDIYSSITNALVQPRNFTSMDFGEEC